MNMEHIFKKGIKKKKKILTDIKIDTRYKENTQENHIHLQSIGVIIQYTKIVSDKR